MTSAMSENEQTPFIKALAANDRRTRDEALDGLRTYLASHRKFDDMSLLKLWKGLFYSMWMSDRPLPQQKLAASLAGLVDILQIENMVPFLQAFWLTMSREWPNIDFLRMDKFLLLVRLYFAATLQRLASLDWDQAICKANMDLLTSIPLSPLGPKVPNGLRYHLIDIYLDEVEKIRDNDSSGMPMSDILMPLRKLKEESMTKSVRERAREALEDERLAQWA